MKLSIMTLSMMKLCHYPEFHCAECRNLFIGMLNVIMLSVVRLNVFMLSVVAPIGHSPLGLLGVDSCHTPKY